MGQLFRIADDVNSADLRASHTEDHRLKDAVAVDTDASGQPID